MAEEGTPRLVAAPDTLAGVFADEFETWLSDHAVTIDFMREDPAAAPPGRQILVARVAASPILVRRLIDSLERILGQYTRKLLPPEVYGDQEGEGDDERGSRPEA